MSKNDLIYYCLDIPKCFIEGLIRAVILTLVFTLINFIDKYAFGADFDEAINNSLVFFKSSFLPLFCIFFLISFILRLSSRSKFLKKNVDLNDNPFEKHKEWSKFK